MNDKLNDTELWIDLITMMWAWDAAKDMASKLIIADREIVAAAVGHEPTWENFQDFWDLQRLKNAGRIVLQREADREKLRKLVFGEDSASGVPM